MPTVSVIVPVYNAQASLARCLDSILKQEYTDLELLVVDDGSTDGSPAICDEYAGRDARVRVIHKENEGVSVARNRGISEATGDYLQFLDADDWIPEDSTKLLVRAIETGEVDMVIADFFRVAGERVSRKGDIDQEGPITREQYADDMLESPSDFYYGVLWNKLYRRSIVAGNKLEMDPNISWCEDFIFNMEYVLHCRGIYVLRVPVYYYVKTPGSLATQGASVANTVRMKLNVIEYYKRFYREMFDDKDYRSRQLDIYRFYTTFAGDDMVAPGPGSVRLGQERAQVRLPEDATPGPLTDLYLAERLAERRLGGVADQLDLTIDDVHAVAYLVMAGSATYDDLADFLGTSTMAARAEVGRLSLKRLVTSAREVVDEVAPATGGKAAKRPAKATVVRLGPDAADVTKAIGQASGDFASLCLEGLSDDDRADWGRLMGAVSANLRRVLVR